MRKIIRKKPTAITGSRTSNLFKQRLSTIIEINFLYETTKTLGNDYKNKSRNLSHIIFPSGEFRLYNAAANCGGVTRKIFTIYRDIKMKVICETLGCDCRYRTCGVTTLGHYESC